MFNMTYGMENIVSFAVGEPDFSAAPRIVEAANKCNMEGFTKYTPNAGLLPLREKIAVTLKENNCAIDPEKEIIVTAGGMEALLITMMVLIDPGEEVIIAEPYWANYPEQVKIVEGIPKTVKVTEEDGFVYNPVVLRKAISPKTKVILLNS
ncbi:MAG: aminotransferase class I/II-fold pyridoxal phosphate-dependent enzyme, partial [Bacillota bacterium]|nr:aminotransferase class I/II-fold pyridoxal phosphate-dependent enzyme [Bacillota bacterium]